MLDSHHNQTVSHSDVLETNYVEGTSLDCDPEDASDIVVQRIGLLLLKLESVYNASVRCIDALVEDLQFISSSASVAVVKGILSSTLNSYQCIVDQAIITDLAEQLCKFHPISTSLGAGGSFGSAFLRRRYFKEHFQCVCPVEYFLDSQKNKSFQYVPILKTLQKVLNNKDFEESILSTHSNRTEHFKSVFGGTFFKQNNFFAEEETKLCIILYVDDFEV